MSVIVINLGMLQYDEFGDPDNDNTVLSSISSYSPYTLALSHLSSVLNSPPPHPINLPSYHITASLGDPRVPFWHAVKFTAVQRLIDRVSQGNTQRRVILRVLDASGHFGVGGRYGALQESATEFEFLRQSVFAETRATWGSYRVPKQ